MQWGKAINSIFQQFSASIKKIEFRWRTGHQTTIQWSFEIFLIFPNFLSSKSEVASQLVRQLVYTTFINNNHTSSHLWWKETLVKYQKVWKYFVHNCLQNFLLLFILSLTAPVVKNSHIFAGIYFIFKKTAWTKLKSLSIPNLDLGEKISKVVTK